MPWVPRDLYELMVDALRQTQGVAASLNVAPLMQQLAQPHTGPAPVELAEPAKTEPAKPLPASVANACEAFAFGDRDELAANFRRANELWAAGKHSEEQIIREIMHGGNVELFV